MSGPGPIDDPSVAREALSYIDPGVSRPEWLRVALAAKAAGISEQEFERWSSAAANYGGERDCRGAWRADPQSVTAATLYFLAEQQGWKRQTPRPVQQRNGHDRRGAQHSAQEIWERCEPASPTHGYIERKGGMPDGLKSYPASAQPFAIAERDMRGWLVVPVRTLGDGRLRTLQFIAPDGPTKLNLPRHEVRGCFVVGELAGSGTAYVVEGLGQAWACWRASGRAAVCAFGAGNVRRVCEELRAQHGCIAIVVVADRGKEGEARRLGAALGVRWVEMPAHKPANYDANDYFAELGAEALLELLELAQEASRGHGGRAESAALPFLKLAQLREQSQATTWLVKHVVPAESVGLIFGASGTFKSFIALDMALHVAHGMRWMGRKTRKGPVVIIAAEGGTGLWRRIEAWHRAHGLAWDAAPVYVVPVAVDLVHEAMRVSDAAKLAGVHPVLVVIDTLSQTFSGEENSAAEVSGYLREIGLQFRLLWQCAVVVVHHTGHESSERPRGSSAFRGSVDFMFAVHRDEKQMLATVECMKQKEGEPLGAQQFSLTAHELRRDEDGEAVCSLVASRVGEQETLSLMRHEAAAGRGGNNRLLLELAVNGIEEKKLRQLFYRALESAEPEVRRKAYYRARRWAVEAGFLEIAEGYVLRRDGSAF